ncbi:MAG TPA: BadF/BadG/BcrA/BcrD ATPase family protein [Longimicrobiales bacterium]|nr:BadF/BadG/BcrA/BcrD ATPase family protein [Longimicrobiales bacterium]
MSDVVIGIDGGGTHARAGVVAADGRELARVTGAAGLVSPKDPVAAAAAVEQVVRDAADAAGAALPVAALCCGLAGAGRQPERDAVRFALTLAGVADVITVVGDAEAAMMDAFGRDAGVLLIAGTGSIAWARGADGALVRVGGWGVHLGDEGSGWAIGRAALVAVARASDGRSPATSLAGPVLAHAQVHRAEELITWAAGADKGMVGALAPVVIEHADSGDAAAARIRDEALAELALLVHTAARRAGLASPAIALHGGLVAPGGPLRDRLAAALAGMRVLERPVDAAMGAARMAVDSLR